MRKNKYACGGWAGAFSKSFLAALFFLGSALAFAPGAGAQSGLGSADDLTVLGVDGTALNPDTEIKGFTVFGSTQAAYPGATVGPGNVVVNGVLSVSSGSYFTGNSTFAAAGKIFVNDGVAGQLPGKAASGGLVWLAAPSGIDNLGNHRGVTTLQMGVYGVNTSSAVNAARYLISGSTALAVLPGIDSFSVGIAAGRENAGDYNTFAGHKAGLYNTTGSNNTFSGSYAGYLNTTGEQNTFFGSEAGYGNTGSRNTFLGSDAGEANTTGEDNVFVGAYAGKSSITGSRNVFIGRSAGYSNTNEVDNTIVGYNAGSKGSRNTIIGSDAGYDNEGTDNVFFGYYSGYENVTGSSNTYLGTYSGRYGTTAGENSLLGVYAGYSITTARNNTIAGSYGGYYSTSGAGNSLMGASVGLYNNGSANVVLGYNAGRGASGLSTYSSSTIMGYQAGYGLTTGSNNIFLGYQAGYSVTTGTGNIVIGYNQDTSAPGANNEINIGGVYKGNISAGTATIPKVTVQAADTSITLTAADFGKTIAANFSSAQTVTLPSVTSADIGATVTVVRLGAGKVSVKAAAATYILNSSSGGTIYSSVANTTITLRLVTATLWMIVGWDGTWTTT